MKPLARQPETAMVEAPTLFAGSIFRTPATVDTAPANDATEKARPSLLERRRRRTARRNAHL